MSYTAVLSGRTGLFTESFRDTVAECGFELAISEEGSFNIPVDEDCLPIIAVRILLKSWAIPPASTPSDSSF